MFAEGTRWPPDQHRKRLESYVTWRSMLAGDSRSAFDAKKALESWSDSDYGKNPAVLETLETLKSYLRVGVNLPFRISSTFASLTTRGLALTCDNDSETARLQQILEDSESAPLFDSQTFRCAGYGNAVMTLRKDAAGRVMIDSRDPATWFPMTDQVDGTKIAAHVFAWVQMVGDEPYLLQEEYGRGYIARQANRLYGITGDEKLGPAMSWASLGPEFAAYRDQERIPGITDEPLVAYWRNATPDADGVFGRGDHQGNEGLADEITARLSQIATILEQHADPKLTGPAQAVRKDPATGKATVDVRGSRYYPRESNDDPEFAYLTWDGQLVAAFDAFDRCVKSLCVVEAMAPDLIGLAEGAGVEATETLKLRAVNTVSEVERKRVYMTPGLKSVGRLALRLAGVSNPSTVTVAFGDPLPPSQQEKTAALMLQVDKGLLSKETALRELHPDWDDNRVAEELDRISGDETRALSAMMPDFGQQPNDGQQEEE